VITYIAGLLFYAFHFPECIWPGRFDLWGASHQVSPALCPSTSSVVIIPPNLAMYPRHSMLMSDGQLWHAAIVGAIILHYRAVFVAHTARMEYSCAAPDAGRPVGEIVEGWYKAMVD
jgi:adiponectin receptor